MSTLILTLNYFKIEEKNYFYSSEDYFAPRCELVPLCTRGSQDPSELEKLYTYFLDHSGLGYLLYIETCTYKII